jgi:hypothetical protein
MYVRKQYRAFWIENVVFVDFDPGLRMCARDAQIAEAVVANAIIRARLIAALERASEAIAIGRNVVEMRAAQRQKSNTEE